MQPTETSVTYDAHTGAGYISLTRTPPQGPPQHFAAIIQFQHGPLGMTSLNGVQSEQVLELLIKRTEALQERLPCRENELALASMSNALEWFNSRTAQREAQGVEGTEQRHATASPEGQFRLS